MNRSPAHPPEEELIALALGESDAGPRAELEAHLDACETCRREYVGLIETLGTMAYAAPPEAPPARLRAEILEAAAREPRAAPATLAAPARQRRIAWRGWSSWAPRIAVGAGALAAIVFAMLVFTTGSASTRSIALHGVPGNVVVSDHSAALESADFAPLPASRVYEMWVIHDGAARPAGVFRSAASPVAVRGTVAPGDTFAVTKEPAGGSAQPTTTPVAGAAI
jgi:anti-sigma-K factor RskA